MGMFSWMCSQCEEPINAGTKCALVCPDNTLLHEESYVGYGVFGGRDAYALLAEWNKPELENKGAAYDRVNRGLGIEMHFDKGVTYPFSIKVLCGRGCCDVKDAEYAALSPSEDDPEQGFDEGSYETREEKRIRERDEELEEREWEEENSCDTCGELHDNCTCPDNEDR